MSTPPIPTTPNLPAPECLRCAVVMELGFLLDHGHAAFYQAKWCAGPPEKSWTGSLKSKHAKQGVPTTAFRCPSCGSLELFAVPTSPQS